MAESCPYQDATVGLAPEAGRTSFRLLLAELERELTPTIFSEQRIVALTMEQSAGQAMTFTTRELEWLGRIAWRNSAKCIGRLPWRTLRLLDFRGVSEPDAVAMCLREHLAAAYNGGAIRPVLSIFDTPSVRLDPGQIANRQLLGYAGFRNGPDQIIGDPVNADFTDFATCRGWASIAPSAFTVLPWLIADPAGEWCMKSVPTDVIHEVEISHPTLAAFKELQIRWYAVPAISNMSLRVLGTYFNTCVFSGWYMNTEIASRNLGDEQRYNLLPKIAEKIGLDTSHARTLWKDAALLELNLAVLHSFASQGVRMVDHHSASDEFERFCSRETAAGRPISARWDWIVPPMSANATSVFHRPMAELETDVGFVDQPSRWRLDPGFSVFQCKQRSLTENGRVG